MVKTQKPRTQKKGAKDTVWRKMSAEECRLTKMWREQDGKTPGEIAQLLHRNKSTITRHIYAKKADLKQGRRSALSDTQIDALVSKTESYIKQAKGRYRITFDLIKRRSRMRASVRTLRRAFHERGITFKKFREKPDLTEDDVKDRYRFAQKHRNRTAASWLTSIDMHIDCKWFPVYLNGKARHHAARQKTFGAFRGRAQGLAKHHIRPRKDLKFNTGARGVMVLGGIGPNKVMVWEYLKKRWNAKTAAEMYRGPIATALRQAKPSKRRFVLLEDNDPSGFKTKAAARAKTESGIGTFDIPKRSPQLNVLDFAVWSEINRRMRKQELAYSANKKEMRQQYLNRLRRTAMRLPSKFLKASIKNLKTRCQHLYAAKGGQIQEGSSD